MAKLADAYGSGPYERKFMEVQVLLGAPRICQACDKKSIITFLLQA